MNVGNIAFCSAGNNRGRVGQIVHVQKFDGNFDLVTVKDSKDRTFTTRSIYIFVIGNGEKSEITLPRDKGLRLTITEEADKRFGENN